MCVYVYMLCVLSQSRDDGESWATLWVFADLVSSIPSNKNRYTWMLHVSSSPPTPLSSSPPPILFPRLSQHTLRRWTGVVFLRVWRFTPSWTRLQMLGSLSLWRWVWSLSCDCHTVLDPLPVGILVTELVEFLFQQVFITVAAASYYPSVMYVNMYVMWYCPSILVDF